MLRKMDAEYLYGPSTCTKRNKTREIFSFLSFDVSEYLKEPLPTTAVARNSTSRHDDRVQTSEQRFTYFHNVHVFYIDVRIKNKQF